MIEHIKISDQIALNDWLTLVIRGDCMRPILASGDQVHVTKKRFYLPGDILVFHDIVQDIVSHRFLGYVITPQGLQVMTKADHGERPDVLVRPQNIIGKITRIAPYSEPLRISRWKRFYAGCDWLKFTLEILLRKFTSVSK